MKRIQLRGTDLKISRLILGSANLHHLGRLTRQIDHILEAVDMGFSHVDTAPLYAFGGSETVIGALKPSVADKITVTTKVCLYPPGGANQSRNQMLLRKALGKGFARFSAPEASNCVRKARKSLENSLKRLKREVIDILLIHEPQESLVLTDEWLSWIATEKRVRFFGVCGEMSALSRFMNKYPAMPQIIQSPDCIGNEEFPNFCGFQPQITYGYFSSGLPQRPDTIMKTALCRNESGAVIVASRSSKKIREMTRICDLPVSARVVI